MGEILLRSLYLVDKMPSGQFVREKREGEREQREKDIESKISFYLQVRKKIQKVLASSQKFAEEKCSSNGSKARRK